MTGPRDALFERLAHDLETFAVLGEIDPVDHDEIEAVLDEHEERMALAERYETFGESYVAARPLFRVLERRSVALRHDERWADADQAVDQLAERPDLDEETRRQLAAVGEDTSRYAPTDYDELIAEYVVLTDGLLDDLDWAVSGDRRTDETVQAVCEHNGRRFEADLDAGGPTVDVDGLVEFLNRVVDETTDDARRFAKIDTWISSNVHVFFVDDVDAFENYFSFARESLHWDED